MSKRNDFVELSASIERLGLDGSLCRYYSSVGGVSLRMAREQGAENLSEFSRVIAGLTKARQESEARWRSLARAVTKGQRELERKIEGLEENVFSINGVVSETPAQSNEDSSGDAESGGTPSDIDWHRIVDATDLPELPEAVSVKKLLASDDPSELLQRMLSWEAKVEPKWVDVEKT